MLFKTYKKEMMDAFRDRRTLLLTVLLPILMMTALTFFYEGMIGSGEEDTYTLAVEPSLSSEQELLLGALDNVKLKSTNDPEKVFDEGEAHAAIFFADDFEEQVTAGGTGAVELVGDTLSQNSANLMFLISSQLSEYERIVVTERLIEAEVDPAITQAVAVEQREANVEDSNIMALTLLIPLILSIAIGVGAGPTAADIFAGEKERKTMEALLMTPVKRTTILLAKYLTISSVGLVIGVVVLIVVAIQIAFFTEHLKASISFGDNTVAVILAILAVTAVFSFFVGAILMITSIIGKTVKEAQSYSTPIIMIIVFPAMMIGNLGINELSVSHFTLPFMNIFAILTELLFGMVNVQHILLTIATNLVYAFIIVLASNYLFHKDKWAMN